MRFTWSSYEEKVTRRDENSLQFPRTKTRSRERVMLEAYEIINSGVMVGIKVLLRVRKKRGGVLLSSYFYLYNIEFRLSVVA